MYGHDITLRNSCFKVLLTIYYCYYYCDFTICIFIIVLIDHFMSYFLSNRKIMLITTKKTIIGFEINQDCFLEIEESKRRLLKRFSGVIEKGL